MKTNTKLQKITNISEAETLKNYKKIIKIKWKLKIIDVTNISKAKVLKKIVRRL